MYLTNNRVQPGTCDIDILNDLAHDADLRPLSTEEGVGLKARKSGPTGALGQILALVYGAIRDGTWRPPKTCPEDARNYMIYDTSRNSSRVWCSMSGCGSKAKVRAYRHVPAPPLPADVPQMACGLRKHLPTGYPRRPTTGSPGALSSAGRQLNGRAADS